MTDSKPSDVTVENHGSIFVFQPRTRAGGAWIDEYVDENAQWYGGGLVVGHRHARDLAAGMMGDGLVLS